MHRGKASLMEKILLEKEEILKRHSLNNDGIIYFFARLSRYNSYYAYLFESFSFL